MAVALKIFDQTSSGNQVHEQVLNFPVEQITVLELIEKRVESEVNSYLQSKSVFKGLIEPRNKEKSLNNKQKKPSNIDVAEQKRIAIQAFESNGFFLLVNDNQVTELDDVIKITPNTSVTFIKLVPLVGG